MSQVAPLLTLELKCSKCRVRMNYRVTPQERDLHADKPDDWLCGTWGCQHCGETNLVVASAYKRASPDGKAA
ncbi:MAG: hypothetical protein AAF389_14805 [Gemmatimonadota bacterium]